MSFDKILSHVLSWPDIVHSLYLLCQGIRVVFFFLFSFTDVNGHKPIQWFILNLARPETIILLYPAQEEELYSSLHLGKPLSHWVEWSRGIIIRELKQPRRRRQQKPHKFAYLK